MHESHERQGEWIEELDELRSRNSSLVTFVYEWWHSNVAFYRFVLRGAARWFLRYRLSYAAFIGDRNGL